MRSGSYERQTTPPSPLWLTNWCEEGEGVNQTFMRPSRRRPFVHKVSPPPVRLFPFSFFFIFGGKPHRINNGRGADDGKMMETQGALSPPTTALQPSTTGRHFTIGLETPEAKPVDFPKPRLTAGSVPLVTWRLRRNTVARGERNSFSVLKLT